MEKLGWKITQSKKQTLCENPTLNAIQNLSRLKN